MKRLGWLLAAVLLVATACAPRVWYKPGATSSQRDRDLKACRYEALARFTEQTPPLSAFRVYVDVPYGTPYELAVRVEEAAEDAVESEYESYKNAFVRSYVADCMEAKGYTLVEER
ncbi:MAG TPA: hypothetical protein ENK37_08120 [Oceanithermus profundus]|uniref:Lipoprotein n=1 Tax=Oceanithermus profundus TaxID=187137 RepID=A0A7C4ZH26_9DEIN|nr:hypothetical protein [Oceanithermus profundus]